MKAIVCKYLPATDHKPSRIKAMAEGVKPVVMSYNSILVDPWRESAIALVDRMGWGPVWLSHGVLPSGEHVFTMVPRGAISEHQVNDEFRGHLFLAP